MVSPHARFASGADAGRGDEGTAVEREMAKVLKLRFVAGKYEGGEFRLPPEGEVTIGRGADLPVVLAEDMVSRKHARLLIRGDRVRIEDLGSTNGTFVNGERVKSSDLRVGDRVLVGTSIMKLLSQDVPEGQMARPSAIPTAPSLPSQPATPGAAAAAAAQHAGVHPPLSSSLTTVPPQAETGLGRGEGGAARPSEGATRERPPSGGMKTVAGSIEEIPLPDILQLFAASRKTGLLVVRGTGDRRARLHIENGRIVHASLENAAQIGSRKALLRVLRWKSGTFELRPAKTVPQGDRLTDTIEHLLMDGLRELDEIERLRPDLPDDDAGLVLVRPLQPKMRDLLPSTLDILQAIHNEKLLYRVMNCFPEMSDLDVAMEVVLLIQKGYVGVEEK
jgi:hypothetical protein